MIHSLFLDVAHEVPARVKVPGKAGQINDPCLSLCRYRKKSARLFLLHHTIQKIIPLSEQMPFGWSRLSASNADQCSYPIHPRLFRTIAKHSQDPHKVAYDNVYIRNVNRCGKTGHTKVRLFMKRICCPSQHQTAHLIPGIISMS
jgi:hypothetical protein